MRCCDCKFHHSGYLWNRCDLTDSEYYYEFYDKPCDLIDDDYYIICDCPELGLEKGKKANEGERDG